MEQNCTLFYYTLYTGSIFTMKTSQKINKILYQSSVLTHTVTYSEEGASLFKCSGKLIMND